MSLTLFAIFGIGAILLAPVMLICRGPERGQPFVHATWRFIVALFELFGLIRVEKIGNTDFGGSILVANHPSLIDVVLLVVAVPRTLYVAKGALRKNPFLALIVRNTALPNDETLPVVAAPYLKAGWNVLIFPEGTRSPLEGGLQPLHRGAAQLALRTGAPIVPARIDFSRRLLAKHQPPWDMGKECVNIGIRFHAPIEPGVPSGSLHQASIELTSRIYDIIRA